ncbi:MAG: PspC domain-containing protein, partial [Gammaproteobacteria bacterium]
MSMLYFNKPALLVRIIFAFSTLFSIPTVIAEEVKDYTVQVSAVIQKSPAQITLSWPRDYNATGYSVYRKALAATAWGAATNLPA